jgi:2-polyprenyl-3-methyl-5-hydroxy-6-metoxy-1,4-benzoquinol methylase
MFYRVDFCCDDRDELQRLLNERYQYGDEPATKITHRNRLNLFYLLMKKLIDQGVITSFRSAIDIGCNQGVFSKIISDFGFQNVIGIDIEAGLIQSDNDRFASDTSGKRLAFKLLSAESLNVTEQYDFILCTEVIEHCSKPDKVVANIKAALAPNGVAVITLPNLLSIPYLWVFLAHWFRRKPIDPVTRQHLSYPCYRSLGLFRDKRVKIIKTAGSNLIFTYATVRHTCKKPFFQTLNKLDFYLSKAWPLKYFAQSFFIVLKKPADVSCPVQSVHTC